MSANRRGGARRRPRLGQHFLRDSAVCDSIIAAVPDDGLPLIEIGAGDGVLTLPLARLGRPLVAVEFDEGWAMLTRGRLPERDDCRLVHGDILDLPAEDLLATVAAAAPYGVVGNLPYAITAPIFRRFLGETRPRPRWLLVMVQREVALQLVAPPHRRSLLGVSVQFYAQPTILFNVERDAFRPPPQVRSAVVFLAVRDRPAVEVPSEPRFFEVVRAGFRAPRKQLHNSLSLALWLPEGEAKRWLERCDIDPSRRAGTLELEEWARLAWSREESAAPPAPFVGTARS